MKNRVLIGTSGYGYREWKKKFYPEDLPATGYLRFYGERFSTVEINSSFYRLPDPKTLRAWARDVPPSFRFSFKAPQLITHIKKLRGVEADVKKFVAVTEVLEERRGPLLFQFPPTLKLDLARLDDFLAMLPPTDCALEFRHPSWFSDEVRRRMASAGRALCFNDADVESCPRWTTADWSYWRLRRVAYTAAEFTSVVSAVRREPGRPLFIYFKHEDTASGPRLAAKLSDRLAS